MQTFPPPRERKARDRVAYFTHSVRNNLEKYERFSPTSMTDAGERLYRLPIKIDERALGRLLRLIGFSIL